MNINKEFWYSAYQPNVDLTSEIVQKAEKMLGLKLPTAYINLLKIQNGGETQGLVCPTTVKTSWADNHVPLDECFGIDLLDGSEETAERDTSEFNILDSIRFTKVWGLPDNQIVLCGDRNGCITLDYRPVARYQLPVLNREPQLVTGNWQLLQQNFYLLKIRLVNIALYFLLSFIISAIGSLPTGVATNYYMQVFATVVFFGFGFYNFFKESQPPTTPKEDYDYFDFGRGFIVATMNVLIIPFWLFIALWSFLLGQLWVLWQFLLVMRN